jgi:hypothetical protein
VELKYSLELSAHFFTSLQIQLHILYQK